jgi:replicative DNA helicase
MMDSVLDQYSESGERGLIGAILAGSDMSTELLTGLEARMFFASRHQTIWSIAAGLSAAGTKPDLIQVRDALERSGKLSGALDASYLMELADEHVSDSGLEGCAKLVRDYSIIRSASFGTKSINEAIRDGASASEVVAEYLKIASQLSAEAEGKQRKPETANAVLGEILTNEKPERLWTGFDFIDAYTRITPENFVVIGARPASGKTSLALGIAIEASKQGKRVLYNCLEMSTVEMTESMISHETQFPLSKIIYRKLEPHEMQKCRIHAQSGVNIVFSPQKTIPELIAKCRSMRANGGLDLVITDFLQKMTDPDSENRTQEIGKISRMHKEIAQDFGIPVIGLSQLSRAADGVEPELKDLRESGDIEQDANAVYMLWKNGADDTRGFKIAKDRRGRGVGAMTIKFNGATVSFAKQNAVVQKAIGGFTDE